MIIQQFNFWIFSVFWAWLDSLFSISQFFVPNSTYSSFTVCRYSFHKKKTADFSWLSRDSSSSASSDYFTGGAKAAPTVTSFSAEPKTSSNISAVNGDDVQGSSNLNSDQTERKTSVHSLSGLRRTDPGLSWQGYLTLLRNIQIFCFHYPWNNLLRSLPWRVEIESLLPQSRCRPASQPSKGGDLHSLHRRCES